MISYCCYCWCSADRFAADSRCTQSLGPHDPPVSTGARPRTGGRGLLAWVGPQPATWAPASAGGGGGRACEGSQLSEAGEGPQHHTVEAVPWAAGSSVSMRWEGLRKSGRWAAAGEFEKAASFDVSVVCRPVRQPGPPCDGGGWTAGRSSCDRLSSVACTAGQVLLSSTWGGPENSCLEDEVSCSSSWGKVAESRTSPVGAGGLSCLT